MGPPATGIATGIPDGVAGVGLPPPTVGLPPPTVGPRVAARRRRRRMAAVELAAALALVGGLAALAPRGAPAPVPESPGRTWVGRAGPAVDALAIALANASAQPSAAGTTKTLLAAVSAARRAGPPPGLAAAAAWQTALSDADSAAVVTGSMRAALAGKAGLELVGVEVGVRSENPPG